MGETDVLLDAVLDKSAKTVQREALRAGLCDAGRWNWLTVQGFLLEHPEADGLRLLAADWLEEQGDDNRAGFIRTQCRLALRFDLLGAGASALPVVAPMLATERRLAELLGNRLGVGPSSTTSVIPRGPGDEAIRIERGGIALDYSRGFASGVELDLTAFWKWSVALFREQPIVRVVLRDKFPMKVRGGYWWSDTCMAPSNPFCSESYIPPQLYQDLLWDAVGGTHVGFGASALIFPSPEAAIDALSSACVTQGRARAGLSPLTLRRSIGPCR